MATAILGVLVAALFALGLRHIYSNFFKGTATCCPEAGNCGGCAAGRGAQPGRRGYRSRIEEIETYERRRSIDVEGMTCERCVDAVIRALEQVDGVVLAAASLEKRSAQAALKRDVPDEALREAVRRAGYKAGACAPF